MSNAKGLRQRTAVSVPAPREVFRGSLSASCRNESIALKRRISRLRTILGFFGTGWTERGLYRAGFTEMVAVLSICYLSALLSVTFGQYGIYAPNWVGITNVILVSLFIYANAVPSGGHLNPLISFSTMLTGLTPFPRAVIYMIAQTIGGAIGGGLIRGTFGLGELNGLYHGGGCFFDHTAEDTISRGQAFLIEMMSCFILLQLAYGCALDPRTTKAIGPILGPFFVASAFGLITFATSGLSPHFAGASMNPARCFAFGVASGNYQNQWLYWFAPVAGSILMSLVYFVAPVYKTEEVDVHTLPESAHDTKSA